ncbi:LysM peptidoglycan-binding domain-containing protein [Aspergillus vadensis CBS 113365]|uniref:LysM domain-containing protein n=1 Tax=Aspergillus vadensis (strain CBS 113365 / IMI 142717 / IBT 24658) TaxID=1448311 RepID=A0A319BS02_ASPVC|nr:hypothetical protein BO88DRAFT_449060 [Aspergillus vadensis CBS 113365]PYH75304.1 hypothetical protein BO88DRAFT_449060 [Aspergillus vadensis CBS 113365]
MTSTSTGATTTTTAGATPSPIQDLGIRDDDHLGGSGSCDAYAYANRDGIRVSPIYDVQSNDDCYDLASEAEVQLSDFYSWNPALGTDCAGLEASTYVCIGTTGPITTINSGTPVSATGTATATA